MSFITGVSSDSCFQDAGRDKRDRLCLDVMFGPVSDKSEMCETDSLKWKSYQNGSYLVSYTPGLIMHGQPLK